VYSFPARRLSFVLMAPFLRNTLSDASSPFISNDRSQFEMHEEFHDSEACVHFSEVCEDLAMSRIQDNACYRSQAAGNAWAIKKVSTILESEELTEVRRMDGFDR
jgi:hypothetical protein